MKKFYVLLFICLSLYRYNDLQKRDLISLEEIMKHDHDDNYKIERLKYFITIKPNLKSDAIDLTSNYITDIHMHLD